MKWDDELFAHVEEIVHYKWDPIGVSGIPEARDEYDSYVHELYSRLRHGNDTALLDYMRWVVVDRMGMVFDEQQAMAAIGMMKSWHRLIAARAQQGDAPVPATNGNPPSPTSPAPAR